nr:hypothetical protein [Tanacetum cinerariifolium]
MANLGFCDAHNMVAYLLKTDRSEGFHQIVNFLNTSHIKYALTENPTIYVSLIQQFWQTTAANTLDTREVQITVTIDGKVKLVSEASIRRHLKLKESDGISTLPNTKNFEQLALMGTFNFSKMIFEGMGKGSTVPVESHHTSLGAPTTSKPPLSSPFRLPNRQETKVSQPSSPIHTHVTDEAAFTGVDVRHGGTATSVSSLDARQCSGNTNKTSSITHDSPLPRVHTLKSDEGKMQPNELMDLVTNLTDRVLVLETNLQQTKKVYSTVVIKLIMKVKKLEKIVKSNKARRRTKIVVLDDEDAVEDSSKQERKIDEIDQAPNISLVQHDAEVQGRHEQEIKFKAKDISTAETLVYVRRSESKYKGKGIMTESEPEQTTTKMQQRKERAGYEAAVRLQEKLDEEERQRIAGCMKKIVHLMLKNRKTFKLELKLMKC